MIKESIYLNTLFLLIFLLYLIRYRRGNVSITINNPLYSNATDNYCYFNELKQVW